MAKLDIGIPDISKAIEQAEGYLLVTKEITAAIVEQAKAMKSMVSANPLSGAKDYNQMAAAMKASQSALKEYNKEKANEQKLTKQLNEARDIEVKGRIKLQQATALQKKLLTEEIALENKQLGTLQKLAVANNKLRRERDGLNLETKEGTQRLKEINAQLDQNNTKLKMFSDQMKRDKMSVGGYTDAINKAKFGLLNFASALGVATGIYAFTNALKGAFNVISDNEDAFASLSAITGLTGEKFEVFKTAITNTANELKVSSTDVAEAAEKIASAQPKLLENADALAEVTKQAIILNKAIKGDLTETSLALVGVMNQFGFSGEEAARVINVLAAGSKAGAATVTQLNESMTKSGAVASIQGIKLEELTGAIETLGEKAIFGADAGTALRNIFLKMGSLDSLPIKATKELEKYGVNTAIVTDKTLSLEERLKELSKIAGDSTAIMRVFGTENATAASVLLNNLDTYGKMTDAVTGTNVANEQMAINTDTVSSKIEELGAKWDNLVIEWASGNDVGEDVKDVLTFITDNLEEIIKSVVLGVKAWILYKSTLTLVNNAGTGMFQMFKNLATGAKGAQFSVGTLVKGLTGMLGIVAILAPLIWDAFTATTALDGATEKYNEAIDEERAKMDLLRVEVVAALGDKAKMEELINRINATYGTTLKNIDDETQMMNQLWEAYKLVNAEMEKRIMKQILEDELTTLFKRKRELETKGTEWWSTLDSETELQGVEISINQIQQALFKLNSMSDQAGGFGGAGKIGSSELTDEIEETNSAIKGTAGEVKKLGDEVDKIYRKRQRLEGVDLSQFDPEEKGFLSSDFVQSEYQKYAEAQKALFDEEKRMEEERQRQLEEHVKKMGEAAKNLINTLQEINNAKIENIDTEIAQRKTEIQHHEDRVSEMKDLAREGVLTAEESIKAEENRIGNLQSEIQELERQKQKLLTVNLGLQTALNLAESGDPAAITKAFGQVSEFAKGLESFKTGTDKTGSGNVDKDGGSMAIIHPDEMIMQKELADPLRMRGMDRNDVATYAMKYHDDVLSSGAMEYGSFSDILTLATLNGIKQGQEQMKNEIVTAIKGIPESRLNYEPIKKALIESIISDGKVKNYFTYVSK